MTLIHGAVVPLWLADISSGTSSPINSTGRLSENVDFVISTGKSLHILKPFPIHRRSLRHHDKGSRIGTVDDLFQCVELGLADGA